MRPHKRKLMQGYILILLMARMILPSSPPTSVAETVSPLHLIVGSPQNIQPISVRKPIRLRGKRGADVAVLVWGEQIIAKFQPYKVLLVVGVCEVPLEYLLVGCIDFGKGAVLSVVHFNYLASAEIGSHGNVERADGDGQQVQHNHSIGQFRPALNLQFPFRELLQTARSVEVVCVACVKRGIDVEVWHLDKTGPDLDELANRHGDVRADAGRAGIYAHGKMVEEVCVPRHLCLQGKADEGECEGKRKSFHDVRSVVFMLNSAQR